jgi:RecB family exonuclease
MHKDFGIRNIWTYFKSSTTISGIDKGNVDRIEERNGVIRIIDYKTGK